MLAAIKSKFQTYSKPALGFMAMGMLLFASQIRLQAQDLYVYYNLLNDEITYVVKGKKVERPKLRKGASIHLELSEFNPFLYEVELEVEETNELEAPVGMQGSPFSNLMGGVPGTDFMMSEDEMGEGGSFLPLMDVPLFSFNENDVTLRSIFKGSRGSAEMITQASQVLQEVSSLFTEVEGSYKELKTFEKSIRLMENSDSHIDAIKYNPNIKPSVIKKLADEYYEGIFGKLPEERISIDELLAMEETPAQIDKQIEVLKTKGALLKSKANTLNAISNQLAGMAAEDEDIGSFNKEVKDAKKKADEMSESIDAFTRGEIWKAKPYKEVNYKRLSQVQLKLMEVTQQDFIYRATLPTSKDVVAVTINIKKKPVPGLTDSNSEETEAKVLKSRNLVIQTSGGLKFSAGVGVNFSRFTEPAQKFVVRDNTIRAEDDGLFSPAIASLMHVYSPAAKGVSLGGSFGIGVPVLNDSDGSNLAFYLGPCIILGKGQKAVVSFGFMGGKTTQLSRGFTVGEFFDPDNGDIPTDSKYQLGYFLGTSFNLN